MVAVARAAVANAVAKVVARKLVAGDRFDLLGADGAAAYVSSAMTGALNVVAPVVSGDNAWCAHRGSERMRRGRPLRRRSGRLRPTPERDRRRVAGSVSGAVDAQVVKRREDVQTQGFDRGMKTVVMNAAQAGASGAVANAVPPGVSALMS